MKSIFSFLAIFWFLIITVQDAQGRDGCGNDEKNPDPCLCKLYGVNSFNAYTGSEIRKILDLEIQGGVGEIPLKWIRYYNSRGLGKWSYSFQDYLIDAGINDQGQAKITFLPAQARYGFGITFTQSKNDPSLWLPLPGVNERLFQQGNNFFLQMANGHRYRFEKLNTSARNFYQLQDILDNYQNLYRLAYNSNYDLIRVTEPAGRYLEMNYTTINGEAFLSKVTGSDGRSVQYNYDIFSNGISSWVRLIRVNYGDGTKALYNYAQPLHFLLLEHAIDPRLIGTGVNMKFTYDNTITDGYIKEERNGLTNEVMATLNTTAGNRWICYANGKVEHLIMPSELQGDIKEYIDGLGRSTKYTYEGGNGFMNTQTDPLGRVTTYVKTIYGNPLEITHPDGSKEKWTRDDLDQILSYTDELGRVTTYTRDDRHRVTGIRYPDGTNERFTYNNFSQVLTHTLRNGGVETNTYNNRGLKTSYRDAVRNITKFAYDNADRLASVMDARNNQTKYKYNERGLLIKLTNADNSSQHYTYDDFGNRTSVTNELGNTWKIIFDEFKRMVSSTDPLNRVTQYSYDLPGGGCGCSHNNSSPTKITLPSGKVREIRYDVEWEKTMEVDGAGSPDAATTFYEYDLAGNLVTMIDARGKQWVTTYDVRDRRKSATDPLGNKTEWGYDAVGNVLTIRRPYNGTTTNVYDNMNRLVQATDPKGQVTKMKYDADGNMVKLTDPKNNQYDFDYDLMDRKTRMAYPGGTFEAYNYDAVNNLKTYRNRAGNTRTYTYDNRNRETRANWSDNTPDIARSYDLASRLLMLSSSVSTLTYSYNTANEMTSETQDIAGGPVPKKVSYAYNEDGLRNKMVYPAGTVIAYNYSARNQLKTINTDGAALVAYQYDLNGNRVKKNLANATHTQYTYDAANRMLNINNENASGPFARFDYGYDNVNRRTFVKRDGGKGDAYAYDSTDQVTGVQYEVNNPEGTPFSPLRTVNYNWDATGNRTNVTDNGATTNYLTNNRNQYTTVNNSPLTYNANGALRAFDGWVYSYDAQDRLTRAEKGNTTVTFAYDAQNRRVRQVINGALIFLYYDGWNLIEERTPGNILLEKYIHGAMVDELITKTSSITGIVYFHHDALGNVTQLTNTLGNMIEEYSYDVFGATTIKNNNETTIGTSVFGNRFLFTGREFIQEINFYDYRNRFYSPDLGRFLQTDPLLFEADDINIYRYVFNNPIMNTDPMGLLGSYYDHFSKKIKWNLGGGWSTFDWDVYYDCDNKPEVDQDLIENTGTTSWFLNHFVLKIILSDQVRIKSTSRDCPDVNGKKYSAYYWVYKMRLKLFQSKTYSWMGTSSLISDHSYNVDTPFICCCDE